MTERRSFAEILDKCVDRVLAGESVEACVRDFPEHAGELREALSAGVTVGEAFAFLPASDRKRAARLRLHEAIERRRSRRAWWRLPLAGAVGTGGRLAAVALVALIVVVGSSTGTVLAAQGSSPGELLYPVMRASERVQLAFAVTDERESRLRVRFMGRRIRELEFVTDTGRERFVPDLVAQIEHDSARAHGLTVAPVRRIVDRLPALDAPPSTGTPDHSRATPARPGLTPGSPSRREVSVRPVLLLNEEFAAARQRVARLESRLSEGPSKRDIIRLREAMERTHQRLQELLDKTDRAYEAREADAGPGPIVSDAPTDARTVRVRVRIKGMQVVHDGKNLLGVDLSVIADVDGTVHIAHLTRSGTKLTVDGRPGRVRLLRLDQEAVLIVDATTGEILEVRVASARPDAEPNDKRTDHSGTGSSGR